MTEFVIQKLQEIVGTEAVCTEEPMAKHTTFRIGGPAEVFVQPCAVQEIRDVLQVCRDADVPVTVIGNGSNLLVSDAGIRGVVIRLDHHFQEARVEDSVLVAQAGLLLSRLAGLAREHALTGLEYASGIPGTVGGAVIMNAGAYDGEIRDSLQEAVILTKELEEQRIPAEDLDLSYRHSRAMDEGWIVLEATFALRPGDPDAIDARMRELREARIEKQPLEYPSAGSTFRRPKGYFAGKLIMDAGLAGYAVGDAQVSEKHCGFVINRGEATADDVRALIEHVQKTVETKFGVRLEPEVRFLGFS